MRAHDLYPGVPAAGHVTTGGHWHPGKATTCGKCLCAHCDHPYIDHGRALGCIGRPDPEPRRKALRRPEPVERNGHLYCGCKHYL